MVKREGMPKGKDMEASKVESPTLVPESAEEQEAREVMEAEAETVKDADTETVALADAGARTVASALNPEGGLPEGVMPAEYDKKVDEVPDSHLEDTEADVINLIEDRDVDSDEGTESLEAAEEVAAMEAGEDTVAREPSILSSKESFDTLIGRASEVGKPDFEDISYDQYVEALSRQEEASAELASLGWFQRTFGAGSLKVELSQLNKRIEAVTALAEEVSARNISEANPQSRSDRKRKTTRGSEDGRSKAVGIKGVTK